MNKISSGNMDFDNLIGGGFDPLTINTIIYNIGSNKLCLQIAANNLILNKKILYIDTEFDGIDLDRLEKALSNKYQQENITHFYNNIHILNNLIAHDKGLFNHILSLNEQYDLIIINNGETSRLFEKDKKVYQMQQLINKFNSPIIYAMPQVKSNSSRLLNFNVQSSNHKMIQSSSIVIGMNLVYNLDHYDVKYDLLKSRTKIPELTAPIEFNSDDLLPLSISLNNILKKIKNI